MDHCRIQFLSADHFSDGTTTIITTVELVWFTPADMHYGLAENVVEERKRVLKVAFEAHPERFVKGVPLPPVFAEGGMDQPSGEYVGGQKQSSVIFFNECPKVVDRFRSEDECQEKHIEEL